jgi:tetratricopeptide (TPR) repeat protein
MKKIVNPALLTMALSFLSACLLCQDLEHKVLQAYELRMKGKIEEAKIILEDLLDKDSTNSMACYEMARLLRDLNVMDTERILDYCNKAIQNEPENAYYVFNKADMLFLAAYIELHGEDNNRIKTAIGKTCNAFEQVLAMKPDCKEAMLYLIDIYAVLPEEMGGDKEKAEHYVKMLENLDPFYGARGRLILLGEEGNEIEFWKNYIAENGETNEILELLGRAYLMNNDPENAEICFNKIIASDPSKQILVLHLARAHMYRSMQERSSENKELPLIKEYINKYLNSDINKPVNIEAWCYGILSMLEKRMGNEEQSDIYLQKATALNPNFSRASAIPSVDNPPNKHSYYYSSYFRPF